MSDIDDQVNLSVAARLLDESKPRPMACCPTDGEPLVGTLEQRGAEFLCMVCGRYFGFLSPMPKDPTPELNARYEELRARFKAGERP